MRQKGKWLTTNNETEWIERRSFDRSKQWRSHARNAHTARMRAWNSHRCFYTGHAPNEYLFPPPPPDPVTTLSTCLATKKRTYWLRLVPWRSCVVLPAHNRVGRGEGRHQATCTGRYLRSHTVANTQGVDQV